jgi:calcium-dependent protein kinase
MGCRKSLPETPIREPLMDKEMMPKRWKTRRRVNPDAKRENITVYFDILSVLGSTDTGILLQAVEKQTGTIRTIREVSKSVSADNYEIFQEIGFLNLLDHPNILKVFQTYESARSYYIVLESADGGSLKNAIQKSGNEVLVGNYMRDLLSAINYMHINGVLHCDLHLGNILLSSNDENAQIKVTGLLYSQKINDIQDFDIDHLNYEHISPEILEGHYDERTDLWSAGIILYEMLVTKLPFTGRTKKEVLEAIHKGDLDFENPNFASLSKNAQDLIQKLLVVDPNNRIKVREALAHPWLQSTSKEVALTYEIVQKLRKFKVTHIQIKNNIARAFLSYLNFKLDYKEHDIISLFKKMDVNFDGNISKDEIVESFKAIGLDCENEVDSIMQNLDMDQSGALDFSELKIVLIEWDKEITAESLGKVFNAENGVIDFEEMKQELSDILPSEWNEFCKKAKVEQGKVPLDRLREYILSNIALG